MQETNDQADAVLHRGPTDTEGTGPTEEGGKGYKTYWIVSTIWGCHCGFKEHSFRAVLGYYALLEASDFFPQSVARLISPVFPHKMVDKDKCVSFEFYLSGEDAGRIEVLNDLQQTYWSSETSEI